MVSKTDLTLQEFIIYFELITLEIYWSYSFIQASQS